MGGNWIDTLPPHIADLVRTAMRERTYSDGQTLFHQGEEEGALFEVLQGQVNVTHCSANGEESLITIFTPGDCVGEQSLIDRLPRANTAVARGSTVVRTLDRVTFGRLRQQHREITQALLALVAWRFRLALITLSEQAEGRPRHRIGRRLLTLATSLGRVTADGVEIDIWLSQGEFAQWVGLSRQRVNMALQELQRDRIIRLAGRRIVINDIKSLEAEFTAG